MGNYFDQFEDGPNFFDKFHSGDIQESTPGIFEKAAEDIAKTVEPPKGPFRPIELETMVDDPEWAKQNIAALPYEKRLAGIEQINAAIDRKKAFDVANTSYAKDIALSLPSGVARGIAGLAALPNVAERAGRWIVGNESPAIYPSYDQLVNEEERLLGTKLYEPKTTAGEYANTIGEFLPGGVGGGVRGAIKYAVAPAIVSETAGQATKGTSAEPWARIGGAVATPFASLAGKAISSGSKKLVGLTDEFLHPEDIGLDKFRTALSHDVRATRNLDSEARPISEQTMAAAQNRGQPVVNLDVGGDAVRRLARSAANQSPEAASRIKAALQSRFENQAQRLDDALLKSSGAAGDASASREALQQEAKISRQPLYDRAFSEGASGIDSDVIDALMKSPSMKKSMGEAATRILDREAAAAAGGPKTTGLFGEYPEGAVPVYDEAGNVSKYINSEGKEVDKLRTLEYWDAVKVSLDDDIQASLNKGANGRARELINLRDRLVNSLDDSIESYSGARGNASRIFGTSDALSAGEKFASNSGSYSNPEVKRAIEEMTDQERIAFKEGFTSRLRQQLQEIGDNQNAAGRLLNSPATRERMEIAFGKLGAKEFRDFLAVERKMHLGYRDIMGGSQTAQFQKDLLRLAMPYGGGALGGYLTTNDWKGALMGALAVGGRKRFGEYIRENGATKVANEIAKLATAKDQNVLKKANSLGVLDKSKSDVIERLKRAISSVPRIGVTSTASVQGDQ